VLTGGSNLFSIGLDMPAFTALDAAGQRDCANALNSLIAELVNYPAPVVSASHRAALGVGFTLMLCADYRLASNDPSSLYGLPEAAAGLAFTSGAVELMRSALPDGAIRQLALKGDSVTPEQLMALGVVDLLETPDDLLPAAVVAAQIMASQPTFGRVKRQVRGVLGARLKLLAQTGLDPFEGHLA
jgi:enoyl-CoA hydratase/carnithine racemase